jgi:hypothetical protein
MKIRRDLTGKIFGNLTVMEFAGKNNSGDITYLCKCKCGNKKIIPATQLRSLTIKTCGCTKRRTVKNGIFNYHDLEENPTTTITVGELASALNKIDEKSMLIKIQSIDERGEGFPVNAGGAIIQKKEGQKYILIY